MQHTCALNKIYQRYARRRDQKLKNARYRLEVVIAELEKSPSIDYQVALLSFINCVILTAGCLQDQIRLRNEFIGMCWSLVVVPVARCVAFEIVYICS